MPRFAYIEMFTPSYGGDSGEPAFDTWHPPGIKYYLPGIYRCVRCQYEIVMERNHLFPSTRNCVEHDPERWPCDPGEVCWQLVAQAIQAKSLYVPPQKREF